MFCFVGLSLLSFKYNEMVNIQQGLGHGDKTRRGRRGGGCQVRLAGEENQNFLMADGDKRGHLQMRGKSFWLMSVLLR